jgi:poly-gamma-glutamate system protein
LKQRIVAAALVSLAAWLLLQAAAPKRSIPWSGEMRDASERMGRAIAAVARYSEATGIPIDKSLDPNRTGLIGPEYSPLFTTLGQLEAKRTTTNPDMAGFLVYLLRSAGVSAGDTIAVGASASFPALMIATQIAAEAMGVHPIMILSLGASAFGATRPGFNLLDIQRLLHSEGVLAAVPAAVSLGGEGDVGADFDPTFRDRLLRQIRLSGIPLVQETDLRRNVAERMAIYLGTTEAWPSDDSPTDDAQPGSDAVSGPGRVAAFVNIGGADANLGTSPLVLKVEPGLNVDPLLPPDDQRGVLFEMAARGAPVIHLLHIRGLARRYGLPWDPMPLPQPATSPLQDDSGERGGRFWLITAVYFVALALIALVGRGRRA